MGVNFDELKRRWSVRPIRNCPGRYVIVDCPPGMSPQELLGETATLESYRVPGTRDPVLIVRFQGGGLISYRRADGSFLHTLNDSAGFRRKLQQLGLETVDESQGRIRG